jgi:hypothetical protein
VAGDRVPKSSAGFESGLTAVTLRLFVVAGESQVQRLRESTVALSPAQSTCHRLGDSSNAVPSFEAAVKIVLLPFHKKPAAGGESQIAGTKACSPLFFGGGHRLRPRAAPLPCGSIQENQPVPLLLVVDK